MISQEESECKEKFFSLYLRNQFRDTLCIRQVPDRLPVFIKRTVKRSLPIGDHNL